MIKRARRTSTGALFYMNTDFFKWIAEHAADDPSKLRLKYGHGRADEILQIECRRKYAAKLCHTLRGDSEFIFPTVLSGEQSTSDRLATFHASMIVPCRQVADLTAGLGIDAMTIARHLGNDGHVTAVERDEAVADALRHNARNISALEVINADCRTLLDVWGREKRHFDCIFIDPARRDSSGGRVYALDQCEPDVTAMLNALQTVTDHLIIKTSPMLDIAHTLSLLPQAVRVVVLGTTTECKELDIECRFGIGKYPEPQIEAVTLGNNTDSRFSFTRSLEAEASATYGIPGPGDYILEPYPAVMKSAPFKLLSATYGFTKLAPNTQLWFAASAPGDFPGRAYEVEEVLPYMSKHIKRYSSRYSHVSITVRNFDTGADNLRTRLGVKDGPRRLFAVSDAGGNKYLITCKDQ